MAGIGNYHDARTILEWVREGGMDYDDEYPAVSESEDAPEGWRYLGRGSYRSVWLSPEGVAYKVDHRRSTYSQSLREIRELRKAWLTKVPKGCRVPRFSSFEVSEETVIAIEMINGVHLDEYCDGEGRRTHREYHQLLRKLERIFRLWDLHGENVMVDNNGDLVIVDWGS